MEATQLTPESPRTNGHDTHAPLQPLTIRPATVMDVPVLRQFYEALCQLDPMPYPVYDAEELDNFVKVVVEAMVTQHPGFCCFVAAAEDGKVVGFISAEILTRKIGKPHAFCAPHFLFVHPDYRGRNAATQLCTTMVAWARAFGVTHAEVFNHIGDDQWARRGFVPYLVKGYHTLDGMAAYLAHAKGDS